MSFVWSLFLLPLFAQAITLWSDVAIDVCHRERHRHVERHYVGWFQRSSDYRDADEIVPGLWLGNVCASRNALFLHEHDIGLALSVAAEWRHVGEAAGVLFQHIPGLDDSGTEDMGLIRTALLNASATVAAYRRAHPTRSVLVYCNMGISRSASAVLAYLILHAMDTRAVATARPHVQPNPVYSHVLETLGGTPREL